MFGILAKFFRFSGRENRQENILEAPLRLWFLQL